jgi:acyl dehydratase
MRFDDVAVGDPLPPLTIPLTRSLIVATAIATRDFNEVHHDPGLASERGSQDIIMNILATNGFVGRYVTDWGGPDTVLRSVDVRLGVPNYPGDTMTMTGNVTAVDPSQRTVSVTVRGANSLGDHVNASVELALP